MADCDHRRTKKNYPFGRNSKPIITCKDCGKIISQNELAKEKTQREKQRNRIRKHY